MFCFFLPEGIRKDRNLRIRTAQPKKTEANRLLRPHLFRPIIGKKDFSPEVALAYAFCSRSRAGLT